MWYYQHKPMMKANKVQATYFEDPNMPALIQVMLSFQQLLRDFKPKIAAYYSAYLMGPDAKRLEEILADKNVQTHVPKDVLSTVQSIIGDLRKGQFELIPVSWAECELALINGKKPVPPTMMSPLAEKMKFVIQHISYVQAIEELISENASLRELYYHKAEVEQSFLKAMDGTGTDYPKYAAAYLILLSQFVENATIFDPPEKDRIGTDSFEAAQTYVNKVADRILSLFEQIAHNYITFDFQTLDLNAIHSFSSPLVKVKVGPPPLPGSESAFGKRSQHTT